MASWQFSNITNLYNRSKFGRSYGCHTACGRNGWWSLGHVHESWISLDWKVSILWCFYVGFIFVINIVILVPIINIIFFFDTFYNTQRLIIINILPSKQPYQTPLLGTHAKRFNDIGESSRQCPSISTFSATNSSTKMPSNTTAFTTTTCQSRPIFSHHSKATDVDVQELCNNQSHLTKTQCTFFGNSKSTPSYLTVP